MNSQKIDQILDSLTPKEYTPNEDIKHLLSGDLEQFFMKDNIFDPLRVSKKTKAKEYFKKVSIEGTDELSKEDQEKFKEKVKLLNENICK